MPRVSRSTGPVLAERRARINQRRDDVKREHALAERALLVAQVGMVRENLLAVEKLRPEAGGRHGELAPRRQVRRVRQREERHALPAHLLHHHFFFERPIGDQVP